MPKKWIQSAIRRRGALRATAARMGLVRGNEPLSQSDLATLAAHAKRTDNLTLLRRVRLAQTLRTFRRGRT
jgi:hypothetical protein